MRILTNSEGHARCICFVAVRMYSAFNTFLAMLTLAFGQILWSICFQWDDLTGGSNGLSGVWPSPAFADKASYFHLTLASVALGVYALRRVLFAPLGYALRATRDSVLRADAIGIDVKRVQWAGFVLAAMWAGVAGALFAFSKGSISPSAVSIPTSSWGGIANPAVPCNI